MVLDIKVTDFIHQKILPLQLTVCRYHKEKSFIYLNEMDFDSLVQC